MEQSVTSRMLWGAILSGPVAWLLDESIALVIEATVCSGVHPGATGFRVVLVVVGVVALSCIAFGARVAMRSLRAMDDTGHIVPIRIERSRFLATAALLLGGVSAFGVLLRLVTSFVGSVCS